MIARFVDSVDSPDSYVAARCSWSYLQSSFARAAGYIAWRGPAGWTMDALGIPSSFARVSSPDWCCNSRGTGRSDPSWYRCRSLSANARGEYAISCRGCAFGRSRVVRSEGLGGDEMSRSLSSN